MSADPGYDDHELFYDLSSSMGFQLVCPVQRYNNTSIERIKLYYPTTCVTPLLYTCVGVM